MRKITVLAVVLAVVCGIVGLGIAWRSGQWFGGGRAGIGANAVGGVVLNEQTRKPEAGVWVIAETNSLPTHFRRIVVTDDDGRFLVPELPQGSYEVWVRGYGLRDAARRQVPLGSETTILVQPARDAREAATLYPANYWLSLYEAPQEKELPKGYANAAEWVADWKLACIVCHQQGVALTRMWTRAEDWGTIWKRAKGMEIFGRPLDHELLKRTSAAWATKIAGGALPPEPPRPAGIERNAVITTWDWGQPDSYVHDVVSTDKRNPHLYPYGKVYGVDYGQDKILALDPVKHSVESFPVPTRNPPPPRDADGYSFDWIAMRNPAGPHNPMLDGSGKLWITTTIRPDDEAPKWGPDVLESVNMELSAENRKRLYEQSNHGKQLAYFDTETHQVVPIDTAYSTHHLQFDAAGRLWTSGDSIALGMLDTTRIDPRDPEGSSRHAQKAWLSVDPKTLKSTAGGGYGVCVNPVDQTIWRALPGIYLSADAPNTIQKFDPRTKVFTRYTLPPPGRGPRGIDASTDGKIWFATGSGHVGRFDPKTEEFKYWETPGPKLTGMGRETGSADFHYYVFVDQFDTLGLGKDLVVINGTNSDSLILFDPRTEAFTVLRIPYPLSFYQRGADGRVDDPAAGWKGRGLWAVSGGDAVSLFSEGQHASYLVHLQMRPNPLAQ